MEDQSSSLLLNIVKGALLFCVIGPPLGSLVVLAMFLASDSQGLSLDSAALGIFLFGVFSYVFGGIPAAVTGAISGVFRHKLAAARYCFGVGILGAILSFLIPSVLIADSLADWQGALLLSIPGFLSGTACAILFRVRPNNSFKPKALRGSA